MNNLFLEKIENINNKNYINQKNNIIKELQKIESRYIIKTVDINVSSAFLNIMLGALFINMESIINILQLNEFEVINMLIMPIFSILGLIFVAIGIFKLKNQTKKEILYNEREISDILAVNKILKNINYNKKHKDNNWKNFIKSIKNYLNQEEKIVKESENEIINLYKKSKNKKELKKKLNENLKVEKIKKGINKEILNINKQLKKFSIKSI